MTIHPGTYEIHLYRLRDTWVFDDLEFGLVAEPLILGMSEMVDYLLGRQVDRAIIRFTGVFGIFPHTLRREEAHDDGFYYRLGGTDRRGWLCPATLHYFPEGHPEDISLWVAAKG